MIKNETTVTFQFNSKVDIKKIINTTSLKQLIILSMFNCSFVSIDISLGILSKFVCVNLLDQDLYVLNNKTCVGINF